MRLSGSSTKELSEQIRGMYNRYPFPNRFGIPDRKSDTRYLNIYTYFLNIPVNDLRDCVFLDAGCGTGDVTWAWRRLLHPSNEVIAIDLSRKSIQIARETDKKIDKAPRFSVGSILELALPDESADVVHCSGVLVAVPDPDQAYQELIRILKPGGYLILALYHKYGRLIHGIKRGIVDLIEPEDIDRRAKIGGRLFGRRMRRFEIDEKAPYENILYDQFGLLTESRYSIGDALRWFSHSGIEYIGSWPPVEWTQFGNALRNSKQFERKQESWWYKILLEIFPKNTTPPDSPPGLASRISMQSLWFINQLQLFSISGKKTK